MRNQDLSAQRRGLVKASWFIDSDFSLCPHIVERVRELPGVSVIRTQIFFMRALPSWPNHLSKVPYFLLLSHWGLDFQHKSLQTQIFRPYDMVKYTKHKIYVLITYKYIVSSAALSTVTLLCYYPHHPSPGFFPSCKTEILYSSQNNSPFPSFPSGSHYCASCLYEFHYFRHFI